MYSNQTGTFSVMDPHRLRIATRGKSAEGSWDEDSAISQTSSTSGYRYVENATFFFIVDKSCAEAERQFYANIRNNHNGLNCKKDDDNGSLLI